MNTVAADKTTLSAIQPSFLPWRGYFQIIQESNVFVLYDDVQYDKHGWRNRNQIKTAQGVQWITVPVLSKGSLSTQIKDMRINSTVAWDRKILGAVRGAYGRSPYFDRFFPWLESRLKVSETFLCDLVEKLTLDVCGFLEIRTSVVRSSELRLVSQDRVGRLVELCQRLGAGCYRSGPSAREYLGTGTAFREKGIEVIFQDYQTLQEYPQLFPPFTPHVSILDFLMNCGGTSPTLPTSDLLHRFDDSRHLLVPHSRP